MVWWWIYRKIIKIFRLVREWESKWGEKTEKCNSIGRLREGLGLPFEYRPNLHLWLCSILSFSIGWVITSFFSPPPMFIISIAYWIYENILKIHSTFLLYQKIKFCPIFHTPLKWWKFWWDVWISGICIDKPLEPKVLTLLLVCNCLLHILTGFV